LERTGVRLALGSLEERNSASSTEVPPKNKEHKRHEERPDTAHTLISHNGRHFSTLTLIQREPWLENATLKKVEEERGLEDVDQHASKEDPTNYDNGLVSHVAESFSRA
jgi:hypothetical protein